MIRVSSLTLIDQTLQLPVLIIHFASLIVAQHARLLGWEFRGVIAGTTVIRSESEPLKHRSALTQ